jgi:hypothetical protein
MRKGSSGTARTTEWTLRRGDKGAAKTYLDRCRPIAALWGLHGVDCPTVQHYPFCGLVTRSLSRKGW